MNLAIVHYHLNRGGVTRVIENHLRALNLGSHRKDRPRVLVLHGGRQDGWPPGIASELPGLDLQICPIAGLDYDELSASAQPQLTQNIEECLKNQNCLPKDTLIHVHNHNLGKNATFPRTLQHLAREGYRVLLQIHDFAEDFRPANYRALMTAFPPVERDQLLYPQAGQIHYAILNRRDDKVLEAAGVPEERRHFLPNPVSDIGPLPNQSTARSHLAQTLGLPTDLPLFLYPVRGIRRKNVGELLLWSAVHQGRAAFGITLAPQNPRELEWYERWRSFATELALPCWWDVGGAGGLDFLGTLAASDAILTTSVAEGFGMVFLEAWLANRPLHGRNLPSITADFVEEGLQLPTLYESMRIPADWIGKDQYAKALNVSLNPLLEAYGLPILAATKLHDLVDHKFQSGGLDFGELNEELQSQILRRVQSSDAAREELLQLNPLLRLTEQVHSELIAHNQQIIREKFSLAGSSERLRAIYQQLLASSASEIQPLPSPESLLRAFLNPQHFRLIRS